MTNLAMQYDQYQNIYKFKHLKLKYKERKKKKGKML